MSESTRSTENGRFAYNLEIWDNDTRKDIIDEAFNSSNTAIIIKRLEEALVKIKQYHLSNRSQIVEKIK